MRNFLVSAAMVLLVCCLGLDFAQGTSPAPGVDAMQLDLETQKGIPGTGAPSDTITFGYYTTGPGGTKYAVMGDKWTWDHGAPDPLEGWTSVDLTAPIEYIEVMSPTLWLGPPPAPTMNGVRFILCGAGTAQADSLGWSGGAGYGNEWCQRLTSPQYTYDGTGLVNLSLLYFNETEPDADYTRVYAETGTGRVDLTSGGWSGSIGIDSATGVITPELFTRSITNTELGGGTASRPFTIVIEFVSDSGWSDEDGFNSWYGAFGVDDITVQDNVIGGPYFYDFEESKGDPVPPPYLATVCAGVGSYMGIGDIGAAYNILDPCPCALSGNVLEMHDANLHHPTGQHEMLYSPIVDRENDLPGYLDYKRVFADFDQYSDLPIANGVFYRTGWTYYPHENAKVPGYIAWSPRVGIGTFYYAGGIPDCSAQRNVGTDWGLPPDCKQIKFIYELWANCESFGVPVYNRSGLTNFSPLIDNVQVCNVRGYAPVIFVATGTKFQDGFGQNPLGVLSITDPGNSNVAYDIRRATATPGRLGDTLVVGGPEPRPGVASTRWEAKLWFRLNRIGPGQTGNPTYNQWHNAVAAQKGEFVGANANFAWGYMDSVETGDYTWARVNFSYRFCSRFRDGPSVGGHMLPADVNYNWGGGGEFSKGNAILPDECFTPGTKVQYFMTANYVPTPTSYWYLPDTTGKNYYEFEILPSFRNVEGEVKAPCTLYLDGCDGRGRPEAQYIIESALNITMNGVPPTEPIPDPTVWDRYDYGDASSNWNAAYNRNLGGNNGASLLQQLHYRSIIVNTGDLDADCMEPRDWHGFENWLKYEFCDCAPGRQGFIANGNSIGKIINRDYPLFLTKHLGASLKFSPYNLIDTNYDVGLAQMASPFNPPIPTDVFNNWCPDPKSYNVLNVNTAVPNAAGNKYYNRGGFLTAWAQVINDQFSSPLQYRTVLDGFSYHRLTDTPGSPPPTIARVRAAAKELENALKWTMGSIPGLCYPTSNSVVGVQDQEGTAGAVTRLYQNRPNPFNPRTAIRFSLAADGPAKLIIYDVNGRRIRALVDGAQKAGMHEVVWDGMDDAGRTVTSGVYWSKLQAGDYSSNRKMVVLK